VCNSDRRRGKAVGWAAGLLVAVPESSMSSSTPAHGNLPTRRTPPPCQICSLQIRSLPDASTTIASWSGEFMPSGNESSLEALKCSACGCHGNFHLKEVECDDDDGTMYASATDHGHRAAHCLIIPAMSHDHSKQGAWAPHLRGRPMYAGIRAP
jgi:ZF-HD homeobox protein with Cys/His-rich dimerization domain